jgi:predicted ATP-dependent protease
MFEEKINLQQIRKTVLRSQLMALESQSRAIYLLGTEHHNGIDLGVNPQILLIVGNVKDIADTARLLVDEVKKMNAEDVLTRLKALQDKANEVVLRCNETYSEMLGDAKHRLDVNVHDNLRPCECQGEVPAVPDCTRLLRARAGMSCYNAELEQHETFKIQVKSICDLALELAFNAAAEAGHQYPSDHRYWHI